MWWHDEEFVGITPGHVGEAKTPRRRIKGGIEWDGVVAPWFQPPKGLTAAEAGTLLDGKTDSRDLAALMTDLMLRGYFTMTRDGEDWLLTPDPQANRKILLPHEKKFLKALIPHTGAVRLSERKPYLAGAIREITNLLYHDTNARGFFEETLIRLPGRFGRRRRTAEGTAMRIQTLGFKRYLTSAEAGQIKADEAVDIFGRWFPYALVFGVATQFAQTIGQIVRESYAQGALDIASSAALDPLAWMLLSDLVDLGPVLGTSLLDGLAGIDFGGFDLDLDMFDGLADVFSNFDLDVLGGAGDALIDGAGELLSDVIDAIDIGDLFDF